MCWTLYLTAGEVLTSCLRKRGQNLSREKSFNSTCLRNTLCTELYRETEKFLSIMNTVHNIKNRLTKRVNHYVHNIWSISKEVFPVLAEIERGSTSATWTKLTLSLLNWAIIRCRLDSSHMSCIIKRKAIPKV